MYLVDGSENTASVHQASFGTVALPSTAASSTSTPSGSQGSALSAPGASDSGPRGRTSEKDTDPRISMSLSVPGASDSGPPGTSSEKDTDPRISMSDTDPRISMSATSCLEEQLISSEFSDAALGPLRGFLRRMDRIRDFFKSPRPPKRATVAERMRRSRLLRQIRAGRFRMESGALIAAVARRVTSGVTTKVHLPVPSTLLEIVNTVRRLHHDARDGGHNGRTKIEKKLQTTLHVEGGRHLVDEVIRHCSVCDDRRIDAEFRAERPLKPILHSRPLERLVFDFIEMTKDPTTDDKWVLVVIDAFSKFMWARAMPDRKAVRVTQFLESIVSTQARKVESVQSDNAKEFQSDLMRSFCAKMGISQLRIHPYYPQEDGAVERVNLDQKNFYSACTEGEEVREWACLVQAACDNHNNTWHSTIKSYPITIHLGIVPTFSSVESLPAAAAEPLTEAEMAEARVNVTQSTVDAGTRAVRKRERKSLQREIRQAPIPPGTYVKVLRANARRGRRKIGARDTGGPLPVALVVAYDDKTKLYKLTWHSWGFSPEDSPQSEVKGDVLRHRLVPVKKVTADRVRNESEERMTKKIQKEAEKRKKPEKGSVPESAVDIVESAASSSMSSPAEFVVECVLGKKDSVRPMYLLKWVGYGTSLTRGDVTFEPGKNISPAFILEGLPLKVLKTEDLTDSALATLYAARKLQLPGEAAAPEPIVVSLPMTTMSCWLDCALVSLWCLRRHTRKLRFDADSAPETSDVAAFLDATDMVTRAAYVRRILDALSRNPPTLTEATKAKQQLWKEFYRYTESSLTPWPKIGQDGDPILAMTSILGEDLGRCADMKMRVLTDACTAADCFSRPVSSVDVRKFILLPASETHAPDVLGCVRAYLELDTSVVCRFHKGTCRNTKRVLETEPPTLLLVECGVDFEETTGKEVPSPSIVKRRLASGKCFSKEYIPMASIHTPTTGQGTWGVHIVAQVRLPAPARPGHGVWYTYDPYTGVCKLNPNGLHDKKMKGMILAVFMREDAIDADADSLPPDMSSEVESVPLIGKGTDIVAFPVETFKLPYRDNSCWMDVCIVSVFACLGLPQWNRYLVADDLSVRRNEREFFLRMEKVWHCALQGQAQKAMDVRAEFWKWMETDPSFHAIFVARGLPSFGMEGRPLSLLHCILDGCGALNLECWMYTEACACSKRTRSRTPEHRIYIPEIHEFNEDNEVDLTEVVVSLFSASCPDHIFYRGRCKHLRRLRFEPTPYAVGNLPRGFIVENDDALYQERRETPVMYDVSNSTPVELFGTARYEATAAIMYRPGHFECQVRVEHPHMAYEWWSYDDTFNEGRLVKRREFWKTDYVVALVYTRVDDVGRP